MMTRSQAEALATFVSRIRSDWDHPGIVAAISKAQGLGSPLDVAHALLTLAENRALTSPGLLHQQGKHWTRRDGEQTGPNISHNVRCHRHPLSFVPCPACKAEDEPCPPSADYLAAKKAALADRLTARPQVKPVTFTEPESVEAARARLEGETP